MLCRYPTTRRVPCQNRVRGEWHKCHIHKHAWRRLTDGHVVDPGLSAWQTIDADNRKVHRVVVGVGLLRHRSTSTGLLYAHGLARPPKAVLRAIPDWYRDVIATVGLLRAGAQAWRGRKAQAVADRSPSEDTRKELSPVLAGVVDSARWALGALTLGLLLVLASVVMTWWSAYLEYAAAGTFVYTWQALWHGIWRTDRAWNRLATEGSIRWAVPFVLFSVIGGGLLAASDRPGDTGRIQTGPRTAYSPVVWWFRQLATQTLRRRCRRPSRYARPGSQRTYSGRAIIGRARVPCVRTTSSRLLDLMPTLLRVGPRPTTRWHG